jgi:hypothetical protein
MCKKQKRTMLLVSVIILLMAPLSAQSKEISAESGSEKKNFDQNVNIIEKRKNSLINDLAEENSSAKPSSSEVTGAVKSDSTTTQTASKEKADTYWVYFGPRLGAGLRLTIPDFALQNEVYLEGGVQVRIDFLRWLGVQLEAAYTADFPTENFFTSEMWPPARHSLNIPVLFKFSFHPSILVLSPYLGAYVDTPIDAFFQNLSWGVDAGFSFGVTLGPGNLFLDVRGALGLGDLLPTPSFALGDSLTISASVGYEFGLGKRK